jgi:hypothetical protein
MSKVAEKKRTDEHHIFNFFLLSLFFFVKCCRKRDFMNNNSHTPKTKKKGGNCFDAIFCILNAFSCGHAFPLPEITKGGRRLGLFKGMAYQTLHKSS